MNVSIENIDQKNAKLQTEDIKSVQIQNSSNLLIRPTEDAICPIKVEQIGEGVLNISGDYPNIFEGLKHTLIENGGNLIIENIDSGVLEASWKYGLSKFGLRITCRFNTLPSGEIQVVIRGGFKDALDTFGAGRKKGIEILGAYLSKFPEQHNSGIHRNQNLPPPIPLNVTNNFSEKKPTNIVPFRGKQKSITCIFTFLLGGLGAHKFYLGSYGWGILYLILCWTYIPAVTAFIEGILFLCMDKEEFDLKYNYTPSAPFKW
jgi:TM2 domain-containing membrane protein YozV